MNAMWFHERKAASGLYKSANTNNMFTLKYKQLRYCSLNTLSLQAYNNSRL